MEVALKELESMLGELEELGILIENLDIKLNRLLGEVNLQKAEVTTDVERIKAIAVRLDAKRISIKERAGHAGGAEGKR
jgi:hypothetical protein